MLHTHTDTEPGISAIPSRGNGNRGAACFPLASSAPLPTWALRSITLHGWKRALSSLSKVTACEPLIPALWNEIPPIPLSHPTAWEQQHRDPQTCCVGWVCGGVAPPAMRGATKAAMPRPDQRFTKSPTSPPAHCQARSLLLPWETTTGLQGTYKGGSIGKRGDADDSSAPAQHHPSVMPCPGLTQ